MNAEAPTLLRPGKDRVLVTGGCGFVGSNIADALARRGDKVLILDSFARSGSEENANWLRSRHGDRVIIETGDIRDTTTVNHLVAQSSAVLHLAGQVAVTTSLDAPTEDFEINARGTLNILEAIRKAGGHSKAGCHIPVVFASTNKVYGKLFKDGDIVHSGTRYRPADPRLVQGVDESTPLDFYSPYGCSKGTADQYVRDYARVFGLRSAVLRMSCIYGPRQFGNEDQGWIAHFLIRAIRGEPITIYGDGYQVRDALFIEDAVRAWLAVLDGIDAVSGRIFNLGGGPNNTISLRELIEQITQLRGTAPRVTFDAWRPGDQPWYVTDIGAIGEALGWTPRVTFGEGLSRLDTWLTERFGMGELSVRYGAQA
jgi:CDP-paratose 2-epimerase